MFRRLQRSLDRFARAALNRKLARQIAGGLATGLVIGVLPKDSALPYLVALVALLLPHSLIATVLSATLASVISPVLDPVWDRVGYQLLSAPAFQPIGSFLESQSWMAWTRFNNSVVMGSLVISLALWPVIYLISWLIVSRLQAAADSRPELPPSPLATETEG